MEDNLLTPIAKGLRYLEYRGWTELIDPRWTIDVKEELEKSGLEFTEDEILEICQLCLSPHPDWNTKERLTIIDWPTLQEQIFNAIRFDGFTKHTLELIDNYTSDILNGRTNFTQFNLQEHAGICSADSVLIGAYTIACYARTSFSSSYYAAKGERSPTNWEIDEAQEKYVQQWAEAKNLWFPNSKTILSVSFGPMIAQGAEAKVYYKAGETSVIKERTSIYSTLVRAFEAIILHNTLFVGGGKELSFNKFYDTINTNWGFGLLINKNIGRMHILQI